MQTAEEFYLWFQGDKGWTGLPGANGPLGNPVCLFLSTDHVTRHCHCLVFCLTVLWSAKSEASYCYLINLKPLRISVAQEFKLRYINQWFLTDCCVLLILFSGWSRSSGASWIAWSRREQGELFSNDTSLSFYDLPCTKVMRNWTKAFSMGCRFVDGIGRDSIWCDSDETKQS